MNRQANLIAVLLATALASIGQGAQIEVPLWPGVAPGSEGVDWKEEYKRDGDPVRPDRWLTGVTQPVLTIYTPEDQATGAAIVVLPGGGYHGHAIDKEGHYVADWLSQRGVVAAVLPYRCGGGPHQHPVPISDAQRAIQLLRSNGNEWEINPAKVGVMGFSAGGHLAATAATQWVEPQPDAQDPILKQGSRPDFAILVYPVISMREWITHGGSFKNLIGESPNEALIAGLSADEQVTEQTPPTLLIHSSDDQAVPIKNSKQFYEACVEKGVEAEIHIYPTGGHGYGMWATEGSVAHWPSVLHGWLKAKYYIR